MVPNPKAGEAGPGDTLKLGRSRDYLKEVLGALLERALAAFGPALWGYIVDRLIQLRGEPFYIIRLR